MTKHWMKGWFFQREFFSVCQMSKSTVIEKTALTPPHDDFGRKEKSNFDTEETSGLKMMALVIFV